MLKEYKGIYFAYGYYWALFADKILNENGFISPILAVDLRNSFLKEEFIRMYGSLDNLPENALDIIDEQELFLEKMTQEEIEKTQDYKLKQEKIKQEKKRRSDMISQRKLKNKISVKVEDDPFHCIGRYDS
jgi:mannosyltransferase OCH1-like enzyme